MNIVVILILLSFFSHSMAMFNFSDSVENDSLQNLSVYQKTGKLFEKFKNVCSKGSEEEILSAVSEVSKFKQNIWFYHKIINCLFLDNKDFYRINNSQFLHSYALRKAALNDRVSELTSVNEALIKNLTQGNADYSLNTAIYYQPYDIIYKIKAIQKLLNLPNIEDNSLKKLAETGANCARYEVTEFLIGKYPTIMLDRKIFNHAIYTYEHSTRFESLDPNDAWNEQRALRNLNLLHDHCYQNNILHHTALHYQVGCINPNNKVLEWFFNNKYNPNIKDKHGRTVLDVLCQKSMGYDIKGRSIPSCDDITIAKTLVQNGSLFGNKVVSLGILSQASSKKKSSNAKSIYSIVIDVSEID